MIAELARVTVQDGGDFVCYFYAKKALPSNLYAQRMIIEQSFRDTKNERLGLGLTRSRSQGRQRLEALLLIGHVASIAKRLSGEAAKAMQWQIQLVSRKQAKHHNRAELSALTMATRVIANSALMRRIGNPLAYLQRLREQANAACCSATVIS